MHDIVLKTLIVPPAEAARLLADAILDAAATGGPNAVIALQATLYGMAVVHGLGLTPPRLAGRVQDGVQSWGSGCTKG